ncbi:MAG: hypothetical protein ACPGLY_05465 [Rubripirellula sp.]
MQCLQESLASNADTKLPNGGGIPLAILHVRKFHFLLVAQKCMLRDRFHQCIPVHCFWMSSQARQIQTMEAAQVGLATESLEFVFLKVWNTSIGRHLDPLNSDGSFRY